MILCRALVSDESGEVPMTGLLPVRTRFFPRPQGLGYVEAVTTESNPFHPLGSVWRGHEFHYWDSTACGNAMKAVKPGGKRSWDCIHADGGLLAGFPHLYYPSNPSAAVRWLELCRKGT